MLFNTIVYHSIQWIYRFYSYRRINGIYQADIYHPNTISCSSVTSPHHVYHIHDEQCSSSKSECVMSVISFLIISMMCSTFSIHHMTRMVAFYNRFLGFYFSGLSWIRSSAHELVYLICLLICLLISSILQTLLIAEIYHLSFFLKSLILIIIEIHWFEDTCWFPTICV